MLVKDKIYFDLTKEYIDPRIYPLLTYRNPEYYAKMNMGLSLYGTKEEIITWYYDEANNILQVPRGEALKIKPYLEDIWQPEFIHPDHPINIQYINNDFPLDEYQEAAIKAMKENRQGIIHAVTSAGKSLVICKAAAEIGQRTLVVVHRKILMTQLLEDIDKYIRNEKGEKITAGIIGNGSVTVGPITIAIDKTLLKNLEEYREEFGTVILDECHLAPAKTFFKLLNGINSRNRFGLSGTLKRKDQKEFLIYATFGQVIATITKEVLLEKDRIVPVKIETIESTTQFDWDQVVTALTDEGDKNPTMKARHLQEQHIASDPSRNSLIIDQVKRLHDQGAKIMVLSRYVKPCYELQERLQERYGIESGVITGKDTKEAESSYSAMKHGDSMVVFATIGCVSTGVSISDLTDMVLISPLYTNELLLHQIRGRLMRKSEGKTHGTLWFVYDPYIFPEHKLKKFLRILRN